ncbi:hypothetical protein Dda_6215 [Drechslerella dactyloides]|uniref:DUF7730 domain-containing protein n=1 Tax=Drechslerella dactyloides TaxID=74499 RepID=A0AAD6NIC6_DREDA|nr:hypothetical protein Dda_6215 [Drechslerella dactyloides]
MAGNWATSADGDSFPFLALPREIRDQIYGYLLLFDPQPQPATGHGFLRGRHKTIIENRENCAIERLVEFQRPKLHVALLRTCHWVHDEAIQVLYSRNVFPVRIVAKALFDIIAWIPPAEDFEVTYETVWDQLRFRFSPHEDSILYPECDGIRHPTPLDGSSFIAPHYGRLIRRVQIDLAELRTGILRPFNPEPREITRTPLIPLAHRLKTGLANLGANLHIHIRIVTIPASYDDTGDEADARIAEMRRRDGRGSHRRAIVLYRHLVALAWPLTTGPWSWTLQTPLDARFKDLEGAELEECAKVVWSSETEDMYVKTKLFKKCFWTMERGRLVVARDRREHRVLMPRDSSDADDESTAYY